MAIVFKITNWAKNKAFIGFSSEDSLLKAFPKERWWGSRGLPPELLDDAFALGRSHFSIETLGEVQPEAEARAEMRRLIELFKTERPHGYNLPPDAASVDEMGVRYWSGSREARGRRRLVELVGRQGGLFLAQQAHEAGIPRSRHWRFVATGKWERLSRGVYRLSDPSAPTLAQCLAGLGLWSRGRGARPKVAASGELALFLNGLRGTAPDHVELAWLEGARRRRSQAPFQFVETPNRVLPSECSEVIPGVLVVGPVRAVLDLLGRGLIGKGEAAKLLRRAFDEDRIASSQISRTLSSEEAELLAEVIGVDAETLARTSGARPKPI